MGEVGIKGTGFRPKEDTADSAASTSSTTTTTTTATTTTAPVAARSPPTIIPVMDYAPRTTGAVELVTIVERPPQPIDRTNQPEPPMLPLTDDGEVDVAAVMAALAIDGYVPKRDVKAAKKKDVDAVNEEVKNVDKEEDEKEESEECDDDGEYVVVKRKEG